MPLREDSKIPVNNVLNFESIDAIHTNSPTLTVRRHAFRRRIPNRLYRRALCWLGAGVYSHHHNHSPLRIKLRLMQVSTPQRYMNELIVGNFIIVSETGFSFYWIKVASHFLCASSWQPLNDPRNNQSSYLFDSFCNLRSISYLWAKKGSMWKT